MRRYLPLILSLALMLLSFLFTFPTGEMVVALPWQAVFTLFMISTAAGGLKRENAYLPLERIASSIEYTPALLAFLAFAAMITAPFLTAFYSSVAFIAISDNVLTKAGKDRHSDPAAALISLSAYTGSMLLPTGSAQNLIVTSGYDVSAIRSMYPAVLIAVPVLLLMIAVICNGRLKDRIYIHEKPEDSDGNRSLRMFYICLLIVTALSASGLFYWFDVLLVFAAVVIVFDRKVLLKTDYILLITFVFVMMAMEAFSSFITPEMAAESPVLLPFLLSALIGPAPAAMLLKDSVSNQTLLLQVVNIGGMALASALSGFAVMKKGKKAAIMRAAMGTALSILTLILLLVFKALPV